jgi:hypothetical protein
MLRRETYVGASALLVAGFLYPLSDLSALDITGMEQNQNDGGSVLKGFLAGMKKLLIGIVVIFFSVIALAVIGSFIPSEDKPAPVVVAPELAPVVVEPEPAPVVVAPKPMEIVVTSQIVKSIGGKYRYFFDIRNKDTKPFNGSVSINLVNAEGDSVYDRTFSTDTAIAPELGNSVYFDASTGPTSVHGSYGVKTFTYTAKVGNNVVKTGSGVLSSKLE